MGADDQTVSIKTELVPDHVRDNLASVVFKAVHAYYQQPGAMEKYEAWLRERELRKGVVTTNTPLKLLEK